MMVDITAALATAAQSLNILKELNSINHQVDMATLKLKIAELTSGLANMQIALAEAQTEIRHREARIAGLEKAFSEKQDLVERHGYHYRKRKDGAPQGHPYCPSCMHEGVLLMMTTKHEAGRPEGCERCSGRFSAAVYNWEMEG